MEGRSPSALVWGWSWKMSQGGMCFSSFPLLAVLMGPMPWGLWGQSRYPGGALDTALCGHFFAPCLIPSQSFLGLRKGFLLLPGKPSGRRKLQRKAPHPCETRVRSSLWAGCKLAVSLTWGGGLSRGRARRGEASLSSRGPSAVRTRRPTFPRKLLGGRAAALFSAPS